MYHGVKSRMRSYAKPSCEIINRMVINSDRRQLYSQSHWIGKKLNFIPSINMHPGHLHWIYLRLNHFISIQV